MSLITVRQKFAEFSGRYDLVNPTTWADNGADFFIASGNRLLNRRFNIGKAVARFYKTLAAGDWYCLLPRCRAVQQVWVSDDEEKLQLGRRDLAEIKALYNEPPGDLDQETPLYYSPTTIRTVPKNDPIIIDVFGTTDYEDTESDHFVYNCIIFMPPADGVYRLEVFGLFYEIDLSSDDDENFWTEVNPDLLLYAALYSLETFYRNKEGAAAWYESMMREVSEIDKDSVEEETAEVSQIEG